jgi:hypothetical protein
MQYPEAFDDLSFNSKKEFDAAAPQVQVAYCIHKLESEVNNGGFHQFFLNSSGEYVPETLRALNAIGAVTTRDLLERAVAIGFPKGYPADAKQHQEFSLLLLPGAACRIGQRLLGCKTLRGSGDSH